jgi:four helix bundle protein
VKKVQARYGGSVPARRRRVRTLRGNVKGERKPTNLKLFIPWREFMSYQLFEDLVVWKRSARLSSDIYKKLNGLRDFGFKDQISRSGLSVPSNIAEGYERKSLKELINFLSYAKGSCGELRTQIYIGVDIGYISKEVGQHWIEETRQISMMLSGLMKNKRNQLMRVGNING